MNSNNIETLLNKYCSFIPQNEFDTEYNRDANILLRDIGSLLDTKVNFKSKILSSKKLDYALQILIVISIFSKGKQTTAKFLEYKKEILSSSPQLQDYTSIIDDTIDKIIKYRNELSSSIGGSQSSYEMGKQGWNALFTHNLLSYIKMQYIQLNGNKSILNSIFDSNIHISGETGSGKENMARLLAKGANKDLISVNCAAFTDTLLESQLFGHCKGAFTGADSNFDGLFTNKDSYIFLDEINSITIPVQNILLRVLENRTFRKLGASTDEKLTSRIITASNSSLDSLRPDLKYRLESGVIINISPLRDRKSDISSIISKYCDSHLYLKDYSSTFNKLLINYSNYNWPGNIRELIGVFRSFIMNGEDEFKKQMDIKINSENNFQIENEYFNKILSKNCTRQYLLEKYSEFVVNKITNEKEQMELLGVSKGTISKIRKKHKRKEGIL